MADDICLGDIAVFPQKGTSEARRIEHWNVCSSLFLVFSSTSLYAAAHDVTQHRLQVIMAVQLDERLLGNRSLSQKSLYSGALVSHPIFMHSSGAKGVRQQTEGQQLRYCGLGHSYDDIYIKGNPSELKVCCSVPTYLCK